MVPLRNAANIAKLPELVRTCCAASRRPGDGVLAINFVPVRSPSRTGRRFQCSSYFPIARGILYKPVTPMQHRMIGILRCRGLPCPPFRKEPVRGRAPLLV